MVLITFFDEKNPYHAEKDGLPGLPPLREMMTIREKQGLPAIHFFYGQKGHLYQFKEEFGEYELSTDLILMWQRLTLVGAQIPAIEEYMEGLLKEDHAELEHWTLMLKRAENEKEQLQIQFTEA